MGSFEEAQRWLAEIDRDALGDTPLAVDVWSLAGRMAKERFASMRDRSSAVAREHAARSIENYSHAHAINGDAYPAVNAATMVVRALASAFATGGSGGEFSIFSPSYFYLTKVPSTVFLREAFLVSFFAVASCAAAAWAASRAVSQFRPSEVLRYE